MGSCACANIETAAWMQVRVILTVTLSDVAAMVVLKGHY